MAVRMTMFFFWVTTPRRVVGTHNVDGGSTFLRNVSVTNQKKSALSSVYIEMFETSQQYSGNGGELDAV
jgi:hypothetical protein